MTDDTLRAALEVEWLNGNVTQSAYDRLEAALVASATDEPNLDALREAEAKVRSAATPRADPCPYCGADPLARTLAFEEARSAVAAVVEHGYYDRMIDRALSAIDALMQRNAEKAYERGDDHA